jgi:hypothetical protein
LVSATKVSITNNKNQVNNNMIDNIMEVLLKMSFGAVLVLCAWGTFVTLKILV